jgi:hypothetical protein
VAIKRRNHGRGHSYWDHGTTPPTKVPGVTTIIKAGYPVIALVDWAGRTTAEYAIDHWDELSELPPSQRLKRLNDARYEVRDSAGNRGTEVHTLAERLARGEEVDLPDDIAGHVEACVRFLDEWNVQPIMTETTVVNYSHGYAGTLDLIADLADGYRWLVDWKTGAKGPFGDVAFQLAAYRHAERYVAKGGSEAPMIDVERCGVVWLRADGYDLFPYPADAAVYRQFRYIQQVAAAAEQAKEYRGQALRPPTLKIPRSTP